MRDHFCSVLVIACFAAACDDSTAAGSLDTADEDLCLRQDKPSAWIQKIGPQDEVVVSGSAKDVALMDLVFNACEETVFGGYVFRISHEAGLLPEAWPITLTNFQMIHPEAGLVNQLHFLSGDEAAKEYLVANLFSWPTRLAAGSQYELQITADVTGAEEGPLDERLTMEFEGVVIYGAEARQPKALLKFPYPTQKIKVTR